MTEDPAPPPPIRPPAAPPNLSYEPPPAAEPEPVAAPKRRGRPPGSKNKPKEEPKERPPTEEELSSLPSDQLASMVTSMQSQMASMMEMIAKTPQPEQIDGSLTPSQRRMQEAHAKIRANGTRDAKRDADPMLVWIEGRKEGQGHYQYRSLPKGMVPIDMVKELVPGTPYTLPSKRED